MNILVSGSSGFIGSHVTNALIEQGHTVIGVDDLSGGICNVPSSPRRANFYKFFRQDIADYQAMEEIFTSQRPQVVYHCAAVAREGASEMQPVKIVRTNIYITTILMELGIKYGVERFIFLSSMSTYGKGENGPPFDEKTRLNPVDPYGTCKYASEKIIKQLCETHGREFVILRPHNVVGSGQSLCDIKRNVAAIFMNSIMRGEPLYLFGGGQCQRAFSYIGDSLPCFVRAAFDKKVVGMAINIGGKAFTTVRELANNISEHMAALGYKRPEMIDLPLRPHEVTEAYCTTTLSEKMLGYKETYGWEEGIRRMCQWAHAQGPQPWLRDDLPLVNEKTPLHWRE